MVYNYGYNRLYKIYMHGPIFDFTKSSAFQISYLLFYQRSKYFDDNESNMFSEINNLN